MDSKKIQLIVKEIKSNFNNVKVTKSEIIDFEIYLAIGSEKWSKKFDFIVRNEHKEIVFVCDFYNGNLKDFLNAIPDNYNLNSDFPYDYFILFTNEFKFLELKNLYSTSDIPFFSFEQFIEIIKWKYPLLKKEMDLVIDDIKKDQINLVEYIKVCEQNIKKLKEDLEFYKSKLNIENKEKHHIVNQYNNLVKSVENDLKRRFEDNLKGINILEIALKIQIPENVYEYVEKRFGFGEENKVTEVSSIVNSYFEDRYSILNNDVFLKRDFYNYYSKGSMDIPENVLSNTKYYILEETTTSFKEIEVERYPFLGWVSILNK